MKKNILLTIIILKYLCNEESFKQIQNKCKSVNDENFMRQYVQTRSHSKFGIFEVINFKHQDGIYRRVYKIFIDDNSVKSEIFIRMITLMNKRDTNNDFKYIFEDLTYEYEDCYSISQYYTLSYSKYIEYAYFIVKIPSPENKMKLSYEMLRSLDFRYKVFIFDQVLRIHKAFRKEKLFGLFFNMSDFILDFENSRLLFDPGHLQFPQYIKNDQQTRRKLNFILPPFYDLNGYPKFLEQFDNHKMLKLQDFQNQDSFCIIMLCIKIFGQDPELILKEKSYNVEDYLGPNKKSALVFTKKYLIHKSTKNNLIDDNYVSDYFFYMFNIFKKEDYQYNYLDNLKLLSTKAFIINTFENLNCRFFKSQPENDYKQVDLKYNNMSYIRRIIDPTKNVLLVGGQFLAFKLDDINSKFNVFDTYIQLLEQEKETRLKFKYREQFLELQFMKRYKDLQKVLEVKTNCLINKKFLGYELSHYIESTLQDYMTYNLVTLKQKLDIIQQIVEIAEAFSSIYPLNLQIQDFFINDMNPYNPSMAHTIYLNPLKESEIAYLYGKKQLKNQFCDYKITEGIMNDKYHSHPSQESYLICNNEFHHNDLSNKMDTWNLCKIIYQVIAGEIAENYEDFNGSFYEDFESSNKGTNKFSKKMLLN